MTVILDPRQESAPTQLAHTNVPVQMGTNWRPTASHALVRGLIGLAIGLSTVQNLASTMCYIRWRKNTSHVCQAPIGIFTKSHGALLLSG